MSFSEVPFERVTLAPVWSKGAEGYSDSTHVKNEDNINSVTNYNWSSNQNTSVTVAGTSVWPVHHPPLYPSTQHSSALTKNVLKKK